MASSIQTVLRYIPPKQRRIKQAQSKWRLSSESYAQALYFDSGQLKQDLLFTLAETAPFGPPTSQADVNRPQFDIAFSKLIEDITPESAPQSVLDNPNFVILGEEILDSHVCRENLVFNLVSQIQRVPLVFLHCLRLLGACHYEDVFSHLSRGEVSHACTQLGSAGLDESVRSSILEFVGANASNHTYSACFSIVSGVMAIIASDNPTALSLLKALLPHILYQPPLISQLVRVLLSSSVPVESVVTSHLTTAWNDYPILNDERHKLLLNMLFGALPATVLIDRILELVSDSTSLSPSKIQYILAMCPQDALWEGIFSKIRGFVAPAATTHASRLLLFTFYLNNRLYFSTLLRIAMESKQVTETVFDFVLAILPQLPSHVATEHVQKLKSLGTSTFASQFQAFSAKVTQQLHEKDSVLSSEPVDDQTSKSYENRMNKWVKTFESTGKLPTKELSGMKMFTASQLTSIFEFLLSITITMEKNSPSVQLVLKLGQEKWIEPAKMLLWEQSRLLSQRRSGTLSAPKPLETIPSSPNFDDLAVLIDHWSKNTAIGDPDSSFGSSVASFLNGSSEDSLKNARKLHIVLWKALELVVAGDWTKKAIDLDKFISCTYVAQSMHLYPLLAEQIQTEMTSKDGKVGQVVVIIATVASHDRSMDCNFLASLWAPPSKLLLSSSKISVHNILVFASELLRYITTRFKSMAVKSSSICNIEPLSTGLEPPTKRIAILDQSLAYFLVWVMNGIEEASKKSASFLQRFPGLSSQISRFRSHRLIQASLGKLSDLPLQHLIPLEVSFEQIEKIPFSNLLSLLQERLHSSITLSHKVSFLNSISVGYQSVDPATAPAVHRILESSLFDASREVFRAPSPSSTPSSDQKLAIGACGVENANPNAKNRKNVSVSPRVFGTLVTTGKSNTSSQKLPKPTLDSSQSLGDGKNWFLDLIGSCIAPSHPEGTDLECEIVTRLATAVDPRWWVVSNEDPFTIHDVAFARACRWLNERIIDSHLHHVVPLLAHFAAGWGMAKQQETFQMSSSIDLLSSSFPELTVFLSRHIDVIRSEQVLSSSKLHMKLKEVFRFLESLACFGRTLADPAPDNLLSESNCQLLQSHLTMCCTYVMDAVEGGICWNQVFRALKHTNNQIIPHFVSQLVLMTPTKRGNKGDIIGILKIPASLSALVVQLTSSNPLSCRSHWLQPLIDKFVHLFSSEVEGEMFETWPNDLQQTWLHDLIQCLEALSWRASWQLPTHTASQKSRTTLDLALLHLPNFLQRLFAPIAEPSRLSRLPFSILFPDLWERVFSGNK